VDPLSVADAALALQTRIRAVQFVSVSKPNKEPPFDR